MMPFEPHLTPTQARAAADGYGWSVVPHDNVGFYAQSGQHHMIVAFNDDRSFRYAEVRKGYDGMGLALMEGAVVDEFAQHGRPVGGEETNP